MSHISVPKQLLDGSDVVAVFKQMRRKRMPKRVRACRLGDAGLLHRLFYRLLQYGLVQMVPSSLSRYLVDVMTGCRKYPLPRPLFSRVWVFALKRVGQRDSAQATLKIALMLSSDHIKVLGERFFHCCGEHRVPVFVPLTSSDYDLIAG